MEKIPRIAKSEIFTEIKNRTGYSENIIKPIIKAYADIAKECVIAGVEFPMMDVCVFSFRDYAPQSDVTIWNPKTGTHEEHKFIPGHRIMRFHMFPKWKQFLREQSRCAPWEENGKKEERENE